MPTVSLNTSGSTRSMSFNTNGAVTSDTVSTVNVYRLQGTETRPDRDPSRKPTGWLFPKTYSYSLDVFRIPFGEYRYYYTGGQLQNYNSGCMYYYTSTTMADLMSMPSNHENRLIMAALLQLKDQRINIGVALGEATSTAKTIGDGWGTIQRAANRIGDSLSRVAGAARSFKKGQWKKASRQLGVPPPKSVPKDWLALQYGWMPLLQDVKGACDEIQGVQREQLIVTVKGSLRKKDKSVGYQTTNSIVNRLDRDAMAGGFIRLDYVPGNTFLGTATRLGLTNPAEIAWELVPFSFVVDWASPIGDWLSSLDAALGWDFLSGSYSTFRRTVCGIAYHSSTTKRIRGNWNGQWRKISMNRKVYLSSPLPSYPGIKNPLSLGHAANGFSLIASISSSRR